MVRTPSPTLTELRRLAKSLDLRGYSKLSKRQLVRLLEKKHGADARHSHIAGEPIGAARAAVAAPSWEPPLHSSTDQEEARLASQEERVESAKYGRPTPSAGAGRRVSDLGENIEQLPPLREPMLRLLPQKPGVLHVYWVLPTDSGLPIGRLKLRLCHAGAQGLEVHEEVDLPSPQGTWYFHVPDTFDNTTALVQLGEYRDARFTVAMSRGIGRIPGRYASDRTDEAWWVNEEDFRRMYQRAGGVAAPAQRYVWNDSVSSAVVTSPTASRPEWPGHASSPTK